MNRRSLKRPLARVVLALCGVLIVGVVSRGQEIYLDNTSRYVSEGLFNWMAFIKTEDSLLKKIDCVEYKLDPSYREPVRKVCKLGDSRYPFAVSGEALKAFNIGVTVYFKDNQLRYLPEYTLKLSREIAVTKQIRIRQNTTKILEEAEFQRGVGITVGSIYAKKSNTPFDITVFENTSPSITIRNEKLSSGDVSLNFKYKGQEYVIKGYTKAKGLTFDYLYCTIYRLLLR